MDNLKHFFFLSDGMLQEVQKFEGAETVIDCFNGLRANTASCEFINAPVRSLVDMSEEEIQALELQYKTKVRRV